MSTQPVEPVRNEPPGTGLPALIDAKSIVCSQINNIRDSYINGYCTYNSHKWQCDQSSKVNILGAIMAIQLNGGLPPGFAWRDYDNTDVSMGLSDLIGLGIKVSAFIEACYQAGWTHKDTINSYTDIQAILDYDWNAYWPNPDA